jgi:hypothetical protein
MMFRAFLLMLFFHSKLESYMENIFGAVEILLI